MNKFEKLDDDETKKLKEFYREKKQGESESDKVSWLYKDKTDSEEYLLGKRIDSAYEKDNIPQTKESDVGAIFAEDPVAHNERRAMQIKQREDPLLAIRKKEENARRELLNNPMKMKQLEKALKEKQIKSKKLRRDSSGDELLARYMAIKGGKVSNKKSKHEKKPKLPDDDKSLLMRYLELIGRVRRKVFYISSSESDSDGEENISRHRESEQRKESKDQRIESRQDYDRHYRELTARNSDSHQHNVKSVRSRRYSEDKYGREDGPHSGRSRRNSGERFRNGRYDRSMSKERSRKDRDFRDKGIRQNEDGARSKYKKEQSGSREQRHRHTGERDRLKKDRSRSHSDDREKKKHRHQERSETPVKPTKDSRNRDRRVSSDRDQSRQVRNGSQDVHRDRRRHRHQDHRDKRHQSSSSSSSSSSGSPVRSSRESRNRNHRPSGDKHQSKNQRSRSKSNDRYRKRNRHSSGESPVRNARGSHRKHYSQSQALQNDDAKELVQSSRSRTSKEKRMDSKRRKLPDKSVSSSSSSENSASNSSSSGSNESSSDSEVTSSPARKHKTTKSRHSLKQDSSDTDSSLERKKAAVSKPFGLLHPKGEAALAEKAKETVIRKRARSRSKTPPKSYEKSEISRSKRKQSRSPRKKDRSRSSSPRHKITESEKKARLDEMMDNAKWRDEQRANNVARYNEEEVQEEKANAKNAGQSDEFLAPLMTKHASESSVEDQIRRNKFKIQRTQATSERNFAKK